MKVNIEKIDFGVVYALEMGLLSISVKNELLG